LVSLRVDGRHCSARANANAFELADIGAARDAPALTRGDDCREPNSHLTSVFVDESAEAVGDTTPT